ncbi:MULTISPECIES: SufE family protein [Pseudomonas]|uniref:Fe-S cluster assembly protein SufE n=1 Tax=Pseudomonas abyssi TaxID=170540 RepID=A0A395RAV0_9PSED|nr:SufE family protein [Halopseudomonas gallaeciensis]MAG66782.1 Fe-S cluster assembly protein SufE [Pseudomonadales bacterium]RGP57240.1 Fe-S cluster assembly protein SufE [Halopseudomonas gallaeciensis]|tara:strand:+ start:1066 stop:1482 length:417 start_codon:yes stop_codon:yes gene_type:complete
MSRFGTDITSDDIVDTLSFFDSWEDRYKYIIDLGRELPELEADQRTEDNLVRGCQSQVWLVSRREGDRLYFDADSDAFIVKGLLAVVLAAYNGKRAEDIRDFDIEGYFSSLNLLKHLSVTRGNGLRAMVQRIQASAAA